MDEFQQTAAACYVGSKRNLPPGKAGESDLHVPVFLRGLSRHVYQPYPEHMHHVKCLPAHDGTHTRKGGLCTPLLPLILP